MKLNDLKETLTTITEPRRVSCGNIRHKLDDIIIIGLCTFLELPNGIPGSDTFRRLFEQLSKKKMMFMAALNPQVLLDILFLLISKCCCPGLLSQVWTNGA